MRDILVVDDHPLVERACRLVLEGADVGNVVGAKDAASGYQAFLDNRPDVTILDLSLCGETLGGLALIERVRSNNPDAKILVFSMHANLNILVSAIEAGATGYLVKDSPTDELVKAVQKVRSGIRYIDAQLALRLAFSNAALTSRERKVLALLMEGTSYIAIADRLGISRGTVISLKTRLKHKLGERGALILIPPQSN